VDSSTSCPRILIFIDWFEPGFKAGGPIKSIKNIVGHLNSTFKFYIFTSDRDLGDTSKYSEISTREWHNYAENTFVYYNNVRDISLLGINKLIRSIDPDIVYVNSVFSYKFSILPLICVNTFKRNIKFILAPRGMLHEGAMFQKSIKKKLFLYMISLFGFSRIINFHCTDLNEVKDVQKYFKNYSSIYLLSNISDNIANEILTFRKDVFKLNCIYLARVEKKKNLLYVLSILKDIKSLRLDFYIFGFNSDLSYYNDCIELSRSLPENIMVHFHDAISPVEVYSKINKSHLFILPTLGENYGHAIIEALSVGRPVLISDQTPWKNLHEYHAGWELPLSDKQAWIKAIEEAASWDQAEFDRHCQGALEYARAHTKVEELVEKYREMFGG